MLACTAGLLAASCLSMFACSIVAMTSEDIIPVQEEEPIVCLLDRLKYPIESDLAHKRKVQTNPCKGVKRSSATSFEPQKVSFSSRIKEFPDQPN